MGRPPTGKHAMSGAERQRRYLAKLLAGKPSVTKPTRADDAKDREIAELKTRVRDLEAGLTQQRGQGQGQLKKAHSHSQQFSEVGKLRAEIGKLKSDIVKLKAMLQEEPDAAKLRKKVADQQTEMANLRRALKQAAKERDQYQNYQARTRLKKYQEARHLLIPRNHSVIVKALHSDRMKQCTADELKEAERLAIALRPLFSEDQAPGFGA
jgi:hypothetical protein